VLKSLQNLIIGSCSQTQCIIFSILFNYFFLYFTLKNG
jgi:hypothetical protein